MLNQVGCRSAKIISCNSVIFTLTFTSYGTVTTELTKFGLTVTLYVPLFGLIHGMKLLHNSRKKLRFHHLIYSVYKTVPVNGIDR